MFIRAKVPSFLLLAYQLFLHSSYNNHELVRGPGGQDMPPSMQLEEPGPGETHGFPKVPKFRAKLEVDIPEDVADDQQGESLPPPGFPHVEPGSRKGRLAKVEQVVASYRHEHDHNDERRGVVDDLAGPDVERAEEREDDS